MGEIVLTDGVFAMAMLIITHGIASLGGIFHPRAPVFLNLVFFVLGIIMLARWTEVPKAILAGVAG